MAEKDNIVEIKEHHDYKFVEQETTTVPLNADKMTNPIHKNFIKYFASQKGKFSIKDILR